MQCILGDLFRPRKTVEAVCIPTNGMTKQDGNAVMGKGVALEFKKRFNHLPYLLGMYLRGTHPEVVNLNQKNHNRVHNLCFGELNNVKVHILSFPTKNDWKDKSDINLIIKSACQLHELVNYYEWKEVWLPPVGCGLGGLEWKCVEEVLSPILDDRFYIVSKNSKFPFR